LKIGKIAKYSRAENLSGKLFALNIQQNGQDNEDENKPNNGIRDFCVIYSSLCWDHLSSSQIVLIKKTKLATKLAKRDDERRGAGRSGR